MPSGSQLIDFMASFEFGVARSRHVDLPHGMETELK